ncbi:MAG TPA: copper ion binding protein [Syntrophomonadaceae bacterium]|nr:copper ion binding protein [Syntrophomonadaceae bacterium]HQE24221.1 copper ion binding protein [Syntrophomonadaceae bacterium]
MASETKVLNVEGMSCMHCVAAVKESVGALPGVTKVDPDLASKTVKVEFDNDKVKLDDIKVKIQDAGYEVV